MTTIVYDRESNVLAADSAYTESSESGGSRIFQTQKVYRILPLDWEKPVYVALAGDQSGLLFLRWVREGMDDDHKPEFDRKDDFAALLVRPGVGVAVYDRYCEPDWVVENYHAIGSGAKCALVALDMGATAIEAVKAAARRDPYTRGPFTAMECVA